MQRVEAVLEELAVVHRDVVAGVRRTPDAAWTSLTNAEAWPVGVTARHIALGYLQARKWFESISRGEDVAMKFSDIDAANEPNRESQPDSKDETIAFLDKAQDRLVATVRSAGDDGLAQSAYFGPGERRSNGEDIVRLTMRHARGHLRSIEETTATAAG